MFDLLGQHFYHSIMQITGFVERILGLDPSPFFFLQVAQSPALGRENPGLPFVVRRFQHLLLPHQLLFRRRTHGQGGCWTAVTKKLTSYSFRNSYPMIAF